MFAPSTKSRIKSPESAGYRDRDSEAVSDVSVTDGVQKARAISFFNIRAEEIMKMLEFWPDPFPARDDRKHLVEKIESNKQ